MPENPVFKRIALRRRRDPSAPSEGTIRHTGGPTPKNDRAKLYVNRTELPRFSRSPLPKAMKSIKPAPTRRMLTRRGMTKKLARIYLTSRPQKGIMSQHGDVDRLTRQQASRFRGTEGAKRGGLRGGTEVSGLVRCLAETESQRPSPSDPVLAVRLSTARLTPVRPETNPGEGDKSLWLGELSPESLSPRGLNFSTCTAHL